MEQHETQTHTDSQQTTAQRSTSGHKYIYAVIWGVSGRKFDFTGIDGQALTTVGKDNIAFVTSDIGLEEIRPERKYIAAHREVLGKLVEQENVVLPMRFGSIADGTDEIERFIERNRESLLSQTERLSGKIEMGLRGTWKVPNIFEYMLNAHPELRDMRDRVFGGSGTPSQDEKIEVGREFDRILNEEREAHTGQVEQIMGPHCAEMRRGQVRNEKEIMNLAFLVEKNRREEFEQAVRQLGERFDDNFFFEYNGPWAPHNFVELNLHG